MEKTTFDRKLDTTGRLVIPVKLREELHLEIGQTYAFYTHEENGKKYLCIECPKAETKESLIEKILQDEELKELVKQRI